MRASLRYPTHPYETPNRASMQTRLRAAESGCGCVKPMAWSDVDDDVKPPALVGGETDATRSANIAATMAFVRQKLREREEKLREQEKKPN